jgi:hypothetical protein
MSPPYDGACRNVLSGTTLVLQGNDLRSRSALSPPSIGFAAEIELLATDFDARRC